MVAGEFEGRRFKVVWNYQDEPYTLCALQIAQPEGVHLHTACVVKHPEDPPNREVARRLSLDRVLRGGPLDPEPDFGFANNREFRRSVWEAYWGRKGA